VQGVAEPGEVALHLLGISGNGHVNSFDFGY